MQLSLRADLDLVRAALNTVLIRGEIAYSVAAVCDAAELLTPAQETEPVADISALAELDVRATLTVSEAELRALDALVGYGTKAFLEVFYEKLGRAYMEKHEQGLRELFDSVREFAPGILGRIDRARAEFEKPRSKAA